jgi:NADH-quinone oxidoreductase subunit I
MESLSNKKKVIVSKPLNFAERIYLPAIVKGLAITMKHFLFKKDVTVRRPTSRWRWR